MSHHPTPRESHLAHEDSRNEAAQRLRDATRLVEAREERDRYREALERIAAWNGPTLGFEGPRDIARAALKPAVLLRECGAPADDGSGRVCRRVCAPGRDYHGGGHWFADPRLDGDDVRLSTARWLVTGEQP